VDVSDRSGPPGERAKTADSSWVRNAVQPHGRPLGFVAPTRSGHETLGSYLLQATRLTAAQRRTHPVRAALWAFRSSRLPPTFAELEAPPPASTTVMFQVRCWEPDEGGDPADRRRVNETRAATILALRAHFGSRFVGGFQARPYAVQHYPTGVSPLAQDQRSYLATLRDASVVVSTTGLNGSLPWKLAEYAAMSKAVVAERNANAVPHSHRGVFEIFDGVEHCVELCDQLLTDTSRRRARQDAAARLWSDHVRPDRLILERLTGEFDGPEATAGYTTMG
jgi:hypothetical protein